MADFFSVQDISLCLGGRQILDHVSFSVDTPGRVIGLLGPNGGGKTTLLRAICGELPHDGHVFLEGAELAGLRSKELARRVSYIPQQSGISISMSAIDVVLMGFYPKLKLLSQPSADMRAAALRALEQVGMAGLADRDYLTLSGGEKQLVILARTLVEDTKLLLFDEPDSSLDLGNKYRMVRMIMELVHGRPGKAGLICLHDPVLAKDSGPGPDQLIRIPNKYPAGTRLLHRMPADFFIFSGAPRSPAARRPGFWAGPAPAGAGCPGTAG